jgi:hypothetical protein
VTAVRATTHTVELLADRAVKTYLAGHHDEPAREWQALRLLDQYAPGLAPAPIDADPHNAMPTVVMTRLPGNPLRGQTLSGDQLAALAQAITRLHSCIPPHELAHLRPAAWDTHLALAKLRALLHQPPSSTGRQVHRAFAAGSRWLTRTSLPAGPEHRDVFGTADGNLANYLWEPISGTVQVVDFEDSGAADRVFELAELLEHPSTWVEADSGIDALPALLDLSPDQHTRLAEQRRLLALLWLPLLLPGTPGALRNPPGTLDRQAERILERLG